MKIPDTPVIPILKSAKPGFLVVDGEPAVRRRLRTVLERAGYKVVTAAGTAEALAALSEPDLAVALVDLNLPDQSGLSLSRRLRGDHGLEVILMTGDPQAGFFAEAVRLEACDFILKPLNERELVLRSERAVMVRQNRVILERTVQELQILSITDPLTGLFNSRHFSHSLDRELARAKRYSHDLSLLMLDLDGFKCYNDTFGHPEGDRALRRVGKIIQGSIRETDFAFRYGGEEFTVILPETRLEGARLVAQRLLERIAAAEFQTAAGARVQVTASIGTVDWKPGETARELLKRADLAMYESKRKGRNRVTA